MELTIDFETRSKCDLKKCGADKYSADPSTELMCLAIKEDDKPAGIWIPDYWMEKLPGNHGLRLYEAAAVGDAIWRADTVEAHNMSFERPMWFNICHKRMGWKNLPQEKLRCSAARAAMCSLPRSLGAAGAVLGLPQQKSNEGHQIMMRMCRPKNARKVDCDECMGTGNDFVDDPCWKCEGTGKLTGEQTWYEDADDFVKLCKYCIQDVDAERALSKALPPLPPAELALWHLDARMNATGVKVDREAVEAWIVEIAKAEKALLAEWKQLTNGKVASPKQVQKSLEYFKTEFNVVLEDFTKSTVSDALESLAELTP